MVRVFSFSLSKCVSLSRYSALQLLRSEQICKTEKRSEEGVSGWFWSRGGRGRGM